jgi:hypothetical protein
MLPPFFRFIIPSATTWLTLITAFTFTANDLQQKHGKAPEVDSVLHITFCFSFINPAYHNYTHFPLTSFLYHGYWAFLTKDTAVAT